jgi:ferredoxin
VARKLKVWVDHQSCVGNAMCESIAAKTFRLNGDRQLEVVDPIGNTEAELAALAGGRLTFRFNGLRSCLTILRTQ